MRAVLAAVAVALVAGCTDSGFPAVEMRNPRTGQTATCPGWSGSDRNESVEFMKQRACVEDFYRQGFLRVP